nr:MAG TPA: hypothetical protein [Caudoviricetes sp.]DAN91543.1 MAG TPA: hypothetical protein [Caudoviricetes sp.]
MYLFTIIFNTISAFAPNNLIKLKSMNLFDYCYTYIKY